MLSRFAAPTSQVNESARACLASNPTVGVRCRLSLRNWTALRSLLDNLLFLQANALPKIPYGVPLSVLGPSNRSFHAPTPVGSGGDRGAWLQQPAKRRTAGPSSEGTAQRQSARSPRWISATLAPARIHNRPPGHAVPSAEYSRKRRAPRSRAAAVLLVTLGIHSRDCALGVCQQPSRHMPPHIV